MHDQRRSIRVAARDACDHTAASGHGFDEGRLDPDLFELGLHVACSARLAVADRGGIACVDAVDADEIADESDGLVFQKGHVFTVSGTCVTRRYFPNR